MDTVCLDGIDRAACGCYSSFYNIDGIGIKVFDDPLIAIHSRLSQIRCYEQQAAPKVLSPIKQYSLYNNIYLGYETEVADIFKIVDDWHWDIQRFIYGLANITEQYFINKLDIEHVNPDLKLANLGFLRRIGTLVIVDFSNICFRGKSCCEEARNELDKYLSSKSNNPNESS